MVARVHHAANDRDGRSHAGAEARGAVAALQIRNLVLEDRDRRVVGARVRVTLLEVLLDRVLNVRRRLVDRRQDAARDRVGVDAGVHILAVRGRADGRTRGESGCADTMVCGTEGCAHATRGRPTR
eukprot:3443407-Prymnesium_polylepis.1